MDEVELSCGGKARCSTDWIPEALMKLLELSQLNKNWNSYDADPVSPEALGYAVQLLGIWADPHWNVPEPAVVVPCNDGNVGFEWVDMLELDVGPADKAAIMAHCVFEDGKDINDTEGQYVATLAALTEFNAPTLAVLCKRLAEIPGWLTA